MRSTVFAMMLGLAMTAFGTTADAQVVPYHVSGTFTGNLVTLEAAGEGVGLHFGKMTFDVVKDVSEEVFDIQEAADGSTLVLRRVDIDVEIIPLPNGLVDIIGIDYWEVVGGTGRFANVTGNGGQIISEFWTPEPVDLSNPTAIPAAFVKSGRLDLGRRR